jgi:hypothetical protein
VIRKLIIGNGRSEREILLVGNITIGRDPACHVSEPDPLLSRRHAEIIANVHGVSVRDLNSRNGILVNGEKTREQVLLPGDVVQLGHLQIRYIEENARAAEGMPGRGKDQRRSTPPPQPPSNYDIDRFRPDPVTRASAQPTPAGRWKPEPTPLPGRRTTAPPPPPTQGPGHAGVPRGRAAFDETIAVPMHGQGFDQTVAATRQIQPSHHDTTLGHAPVDLDATMLAPASRDASGGNRWNDPDATMLASGPITQPASPDSTMTPGNATFASALAHLQGIATPGNEQVHPGPGARLVANAELTVTDATPGCAELLGVPDDELIGDSLTDVFLRGVRRAYAEPDTELSLTVARGPRGSITVTFTLDKTGGTE